MSTPLETQTSLSDRTGMKNTTGVLLFEHTMFACYIDDSADAQQKTIYSVAGFVAESAEWFDVSRYWSRRLESEGLDYFRTYECVNLEGEFRRKLVDRHGLTTARVIADAVLADLKQIVATSNLYAFCMGVLMDDYRQVSSEPDGEIVLNKDPYVFAHQMFIGIVLGEVRKFPYRQIVAFHYDEHSKAGMFQRSWEGYKECNPNWAESAGVLEPLDDKRNVPVQVADLLAHTTTRMFQQWRHEPEAAVARMKGWLKGNLMRVPYTNAEFLRTLVAGNVERLRAKGAKGGLVVPVEVSG
ncbi:MAG: DUF3800 domain-containing protein [Candidatus Sulfotelmatobacter sp.]